MVATSSSAEHLLVAKIAAENLPPVSSPSLGGTDHGRVPDQRHLPWVDSASLKPGQVADVRDGGAVWVGEGPFVALLDRSRWVAQSGPPPRAPFVSIGSWSNRIGGHARTKRHARLGVRTTQ